MCLNLEFISFGFHLQPTPTCLGKKNYVVVVDIRRKWRLKKKKRGSQKGRRSPNATRLSRQMQNDPLSAAINNISSQKNKTCTWLVRSSKYNVSAVVMEVSFVKLELFYPLHICNSYRDLNVAASPANSTASLSETAELELDAAWFSVNLVANRVTSQYQSHVINSLVLVV